MSSDETVQPQNSLESVDISSQPIPSMSNNSDDLVVSVRCYLKILMHALRYPHAIVNGLLIMEKKKKSSKSNKLVDCIPLFHSGHGLTPMLEVALNQVSDYFNKNTNLVIGGYYQANEFFHELTSPTPNVFAERIAEKLYEANPDSVIFMLSDFNLATSIDDAENLNLPLFMYTYMDGKLKLKNNFRGFQLENFNLIYKAIQELVFKKQYHLNIVDFDSHLENVKYDWRNIKLNEAIENFERQ